jgi:FMN-dependent NADH-azoreductase
MTKLLYIEASPRKKRSSSIAVANTFLDTYRKTHPQDEVLVIDLWQKEMPPFDGEVIDAKYAIMHNQAKSSEQIKAWSAVETIISEFKAADKYLFSVPMWNFSIPYRLKHYIDILVQPGHTFAVVDGEYKGLVTNKKALLIYSRGGSYTADDVLDLQIRYMQTILGFIGLKNCTSIVIQPTLGNPEEKKKSLETANKQAQTLAAQY